MQAIQASHSVLTVSDRADARAQSKFWAVRDYLSPVSARRHRTVLGSLTTIDAGAAREQVQGDRLHHAWSVLHRCVLVVADGARTEEFVAAGDFLTYKFPVWSWSVACRLLFR